MKPDFEKLKTKVENKEALSSIYEFELACRLYPTVVMNLEGSLDLALEFWNQGTSSDKELVSQLVEESDLVESFNNKLGLPKESKFFYNRGIWSCDQLSYFKVHLDLETQERLKNLHIKVEVPLKLCDNKVATFAPSAVSSFNFLNEGTKKALQLTLGLSLIGFASLNTNSLSPVADFLKSKTIIELDLNQNLNQAVNQLESLLQNSKHPRIVNLLTQIKSLDLDFHPQEEEAPLKPSQALIEDMILSFYETQNPAHISKIKAFIPKIAQSIIKHTEDNHIDYKLLLSILKVESDFNQKTISKTFDYSLAQINYDIWVTEFKKEKNIILDKNKLKHDIDYSINMMTQIISILEKRHSQDPYWYARYHSSTPSRKLVYAGKIHNVLGSLKIEEYNFKKNQYRHLKKLLKTIDEDLAAEAKIDFDSVKSTISQLNRLEQESSEVKVALK